MYEVLESFPNHYGSFVAGTKVSLRDVPEEVIASWVENKLVRKVEQVLSEEPMLSEESPRPRLPKARS